MANMAQMVNVIAPMFTNEKGMFLQTIYYPLQLFANNSKGQGARAVRRVPKYESKRFGDVPYLDVSAAYDNGVARDQRGEPPPGPGDRSDDLKRKTRASPVRSKCPK